MKQLVWESAKAKKAPMVQTPDHGPDHGAIARRLRQELAESDTEVAALRRKLDTEQKRADRLAAELESEKTAHSKTKLDHAAKIKSAMESRPKIVVKQAESKSVDREVSLGLGDTKVGIASLHAAVREAIAMIAELKAERAVPVERAESQTRVKRRDVSYKFKFQRDSRGFISGATAEPEVIIEGD